MDALAGGFESAVRSYDLTLPGAREAVLQFGSDDLVFLGFPVYGGRAPRNARQVFASLEANRTPAVLVSVYGNRAWERSLADLDGFARERGFVPVAGAAALAQHVLAPHIATGRPDADDAAALAGFAREVARRLGNGLWDFTAPGADAEWLQGSPRGAFLPAGDPVLCRECGRCAAFCPAGAIEPGNPRVSDIKKCIFCSACTLACPYRARTYPHPMMRVLVTEHLKNAHFRKEAEFFF